MAAQLICQGCIHLHAPGAQVRQEHLGDFELAAPPQAALAGQGRSSGGQGPAHVAQAGAERVGHASAGKERARGAAGAADGQGWAGSHHLRPAAAWQREQTGGRRWQKVGRLVACDSGRGAYKRRRGFGMSEGSCRAPGISKHWAKRSREFMPASPEIGFREGCQATLTAVL